MRYYLYHFKSKNAPVRGRVCTSKEARIVPDLGYALKRNNYTKQSYPSLYLSNAMIEAKSQVPSAAITYTRCTRVSPSANLPLLFPPSHFFHPPPSSTTCSLTSTHPLTSSLTLTTSPQCRPSSHDLSSTNCVISLVHHTNLIIPSPFIPSISLLEKLQCIYQDDAVIRH
jgi:hypothetical protein